MPAHLLPDTPRRYDAPPLFDRPLAASSSSDATVDVRIGVTKIEVRFDCAGPEKVTDSAPTG